MKSLDDTTNAFCNDEVNQRSNPNEPIDLSAIFHAPDLYPVFTRLSDHPTVRPLTGSALIRLFLKN